jgi:hypothetical protein
MARLRTRAEIGVVRHRRRRRRLGDPQHLLRALHRDLERLETLRHRRELAGMARLSRITQISPLSIT